MISERQTNTLLDKHPNDHLQDELPIENSPSLRNMENTQENTPIVKASLVDKEVYHQVHDIQVKMAKTLNEVKIKIENAKFSAAKQSISSVKQLRELHSHQISFTSNYLLPCELAIEEVVAKKEGDLKSFVNVYTLLLSALTSFCEQFQTVFSFDRNERLHTLLNQLQTALLLFQNHDKKGFCRTSCNLLLQLIEYIQLDVNETSATNALQPSDSKEKPNKPRKKERRLKMYESTTKKVITVKKTTKRSQVTIESKHSCKLRPAPGANYTRKNRLALKKSEKDKSHKKGTDFVFLVFHSVWKKIVSFWFLPGKLMLSRRKKMKTARVAMLQVAQPP